MVRSSAAHHLHHSGWLSAGNNASQSGCGKFLATVLEALYSLIRLHTYHSLLLEQPDFVQQSDSAIKELHHQPALQLTAVACLASLCKAKMLAASTSAAACHHLHSSAARRHGTFELINDCVTGALLVSAFVPTTFFLHE